MKNEICQYEEQNHEELVERFMADPKIKEEYEEFVYVDFINSLPDEDILRGDR